MTRMDRWSSWTPTWVDRPGRWSGAVVTAAGLGVCWLIALQSGPVTAVSRHWFYIPVVFAAARFGLSGALGVGIAAGLLAGPLAGGLATSSVDAPVWLFQAAFFVGVGVVVAALVTTVRCSGGSELALAQRDAVLAHQQATFIQTISHEFRTPLTVLRGGIELLDQQQERIDPALRPLVAGLRRAERRLDQMVSTVLASVEAADMSQRLETTPVQVAELTADIVASLEGEHASGRVRSEMPARAVVTVRSYLRLILHALIDNALRFTPEDREVIVTAEIEADQAVIRVRDYGQGMDEKLLEVAFEPFTQGDGSSQRAHGGLGAGLFTARRLTERLDGTLTATRADPGLIFTVTLPQRRDTDGKETPRPAPGARASALPGRP